jgi:hypothetical protein
MRRDETPTRRTNPSGEVRFVARYTGSDGTRRSAGTYEKRGPCKRPAPGCCAQHAIWQAYENDAPPEEKPLTVRGYFEGDWLKRHPRMHRTELNYRNGVKAVLEVRTDGQPFGDLPIARVRARHIDDLGGRDAPRRPGRLGRAGRAECLERRCGRDAIRDEVAEMNPVLYVTVRDNDPRVTRPARKRRRRARGRRCTRFAAAGWPVRADDPDALSDCGLRIGELLGARAAAMTAGDVPAAGSRTMRGAVGCTRALKSGQWPDASR